MYQKDRLSVRITLTVSDMSMPLSTENREQVVNELREIASNWEKWVHESIYDSAAEDVADATAGYTGLSLLNQILIDPTDKDVITNA
jgi:predicted metal-dependent HD superfamily phosphohydrolase